MNQFIEIKNHIIKIDSINYVTTEIEYSFNNYNILIYIKGKVKPIKIDYASSDSMLMEFKYIKNLLCKK